MPLLLSELLADPALGLALVAGHGGLSERGPVRWAHISEIPDPTPWLEGGEVLLTTGLSLRDSPGLQRRLIAGLDERGCAGVGFGLGVCLDAVPPAMLAEAETRRMPLFTVPYEVPFIAVTKQVSHAIAAEHYATLRSAINLHRHVLAAVVTGSGVQGVLETIAGPLAGFACLVFDYYGQLLAAHDPAQTIPDLDPARLWEVASPQHHDRDRFEASHGALHVTGGVVRVGDEVEAVLVLIGARPLHEHEALLMEQGLTGVSLELARGLSVRQAHRSRVDELLEEVATGRASHQATERQLVRLGFDATRSYRLLCLRRPDRVSERALCALAEDVIAVYGHPILGRYEGDVYCVVQPGDADQAERIVAAANGRGWRELHVGRSRPKRDLGALAAGLREAEVAASARRPGTAGVRDVTSLGLTGLLAGIGHDLGAHAFVQHVLGPVLDHDAREVTPLADTLRAYLRHGCRPGPAAEELCVHRHTLAYRLDRIRDLTGRDPRDGAHLLEFGLALELEANRALDGEPA